MNDARLNFIASQLYLWCSADEMQGFDEEKAFLRTGAAKDTFFLPVTRKKFIV